MRRKSTGLSRFVGALLGSVVVTGAMLGVALVAGACGGSGDSDDGSGTTGKRVTLHTVAVAADSIDAAVLNKKGWSVHLTELVVALGPFYYFDGAPIFSQLQTPPSFPIWHPAQRPLQVIFGLRTANANPGHYQQGNARGQMLESTVVDLLPGAAPLADGDGVTGVVRSGQFSFGDPPEGGAIDKLEGHVVRVSGTATKGSETRVFRMFADRTHLVDSYDLPKLDGCLFEESNMQGDGTVTIAIYPSVWFDQTDFVGVAESQDGEPVVVDPSESAHRAFARGLKKGSAYVFSYAADATQ